jgi:hypothetical protein
MLDMVAKARGVLMGDTVPNHYVHGMEPGQPGHLYNHPAGAGRPVNHSLAAAF